ncbi:MAG: HAMP domain-containing sensor histidine kinase [Myxococcales bacterium]|nr:HAMP domain-containing sensor histidine kinase [Myxococcales bacterium]MDP3503926.1 HAMP domain-containing sensor histidine kinase [Myxococcales bacterium]
MTLSTRLWLWGAVLPACVLGGVLFGADQLFHGALERSLDQALLAQAAIESVSLFDGPKNEPHLHMATSPLVDSVRPFAPEGILFGPDGEEVMRYPPPLGGEPVEHVAIAQISSTPLLSTVEHEGHRHRELVVGVKSPGGEAYALKLSASLAQTDASTRTFHLIALFSTAATAIALVLVQALQGRGLRARLAALRSHLEAVRAGELEKRLEPDREGDEVSEVHEVLGQATERLQSARDSRERLLADAAHELRTPLSLMRTRLDLALRRERSTDELKTALSETREEVVRLATLAGRLLDSAAHSHGPLIREPVDLVLLARDAVASAQSGASPRHVTISIEGPDTCAASGNVESLRQALDNLLANALKFAPDQSTIVVTVKRENTTLSLSVKDQGPGIPEAEREIVFEPFHRVRGGPPGTGLGLTIVREIATRHGGRSYVAPTSGGAEVVLELPAV